MLNNKFFSIQHAMQRKKKCVRRTCIIGAITLLAQTAGLALVIIIFLMFGKSYISLKADTFIKERDVRTANMSLDSSDVTYDNCQYKSSVVAVSNNMRKSWGNTSGLNRAWKAAERDAQQPVHKYLEREHSVAIYMYTKDTSLHIAPNPNKGTRAAEGTDATMITFRLFDHYLSEALQILKHSQLSCLSTFHRTETFSFVPNKQIRFSDFVLTSVDKKRNSSGETCLEIYTCFGADVTRYSARDQERQVLIPPYEVFKITRVRGDDGQCAVSYKLRSNTNCVHNSEMDVLQPISAPPIDEDEVILLTVTICIVGLCLSIVVISVKVFIIKCKPVDDGSRRVFLTTDHPHDRIYHTDHPF